jgi:hypothetical protein
MSVTTKNASVVKDLKAMTAHFSAVQVTLKSAADMVHATMWMVHAHVHLVLQVLGVARRSLPVPQTVPVQNMESVQKSATMNIDVCAKMDMAVQRAA